MATSFFQGIWFLNRRYLLLSHNILKRNQHIFSAVNTCRDHNCLKSFNSSFSTSAIQPQQVEKKEVDFTNTEKAFRSKTTYELLRTYVVFKLLKYEFLVEKSDKLLALLRRLVGGTLYKAIMKQSLFGQFVIGEDAMQAKESLQRFTQQGIHPILAFAKEDEMDTTLETDTNANFDETAFDNNLQYAVDCLHVVADTSEFPFSATKMTALCHHKLLYTFSEALVGSEQLFLSLADSPDLLNGRITSDSFMRGAERMKLGLKENEINKLWQNATSNDSMNFFEWNDAFIAKDCDTELYRTFATKFSPAQSHLPIMSEKEKAQMKNVTRRMETLADVAQERGVRLMVDAEHDYYQPAIRHITVHRLMPKYNLTTPIIYNTQQCYLKHGLAAITRDFAAAMHYNNMFGIKIVRGAYLDHERQLAAAKGCEDPIWSTKPETDANYHKVLRFVLDKVKKGKAKVMIATHNDKTLHFAMERISSLGLDARDGSVVFGQQYGMSDNLTFTLANHGYVAYKYAPYGPVEEVLPYLIRRAKENRGMVAGAVRERSLIKRELKRRLTNK